ncbi:MULTISPECIES: hypothetical protein [unclassified Thalassospira]|jgi:hypothetical protein|uniref:hypothetical protein n=1 Tax=unclassified Thalassospira TaxID=2648997 RepID=UPI000A1EE6F9|nr:hypothetical protein [Thalassospira sp. MCCC 1A01428]OSQ46341.1 hypothetical protein THS27_00440 [Thalassospira sp. MCCC 1A01428]
MDYTLTLNVDPTDLNIINGAQQKIALAKPVGNSSVSVIWVAFDPFESNSIQWSEEYWLYASTASTGTNGEKITKLSEVQPGPSMTGSIYTFGDSATFGQPVKSADVASGTFAAQNDMSYGKYPCLTFGLSQTAQVNQKIEERKPISANSVLATQQIQVTPYTHVYIWLEGHFESSTIITDVTGKQSVAKFGGGVNEIAMTYDGKSGLFHQ